MKKRRFTRGSNAIDAATTTNKDWGFKPVPGKGGASTNSEIPDWMFEKELKERKNGGAVNA